MATQSDERERRLRAFNEQHASAASDRQKHREHCLNAAFNEGLLAGFTCLGLLSSANLIYRRPVYNPSMRAFGFVFSFFLPFCLSA